MNVSWNHYNEKRLLLVRCAIKHPAEVVATSSSWIWAWRQTTLHFIETLNKYVTNRWYQWSKTEIKNFSFSCFYHVPFIVVIERHPLVWNGSTEIITIRKRFYNVKTSAHLRWWALRCQINLIDHRTHTCNLSFHRFATGNTFCSPSTAVFTGLVLKSDCLGHGVK